MREAAEIVGEAEDRRLLPLALAGAALHLQIELVEHAQARGADRMAEAFEAAIDLAGERAAGIEDAVHDVPDRAALRREAEILHGDELGDREAVMHLDQRELAARVGYPGLGIGAARGDPG